MSINYNVFTSGPTRKGLPEDLGEYKPKYPLGYVPRDIGILTLPNDGLPKAKPQRAPIHDPTPTQAAAAAARGRAKVNPSARARPGSMAFALLERLEAEPKRLFTSHELVDGLDFPARRATNALSWHIATGRVRVVREQGRYRGGCRALYQLASAAEANA